jgi:hypothetical protein
MSARPATDDLPLLTIDERVRFHARPIMLCRWLPAGLRYVILMTKSDGAFRETLEGVCRENSVSVIEYSNPFAHKLVLDIDPAARFTGRAESILMVWDLALEPSADANLRQHVGKDPHAILKGATPNMLCILGGKHNPNLPLGEGKVRPHHVLEHSSTGRRVEYLWTNYAIKIAGSRLGEAEFEPLAPLLWFDSSKRRHAAREKVLKKIQSLEKMHHLERLEFRHRLAKLDMQKQQT